MMLNIKVYNYILSFLGKPQGNEDVILALCTMCPAEVIISKIEEKEGCFDPVMLSNYMNAQDLKEWQKEVTYCLENFLTRKKTTAYHILQLLHKEDLFDIVFYEETTQQQKNESRFGIAEWRLRNYGSAFDPDVTDGDDDAPINPARVDFKRAIMPSGKV